MSRLTRKTVIQAQLESTYGANPGGWSPAMAILIVSPSFRIARDVVPRELVRDHLGGSEHLIGARRAEIGFQVELAGSGAAGTPPPWAPLLRACGMAETVTPASHVEYNPISGGFESLTIRYLLDGVMHVARGCRGNVKFNLDADARPMMTFSFIGYDSTAYADDAVGANFSAWQRPLVVTDANSGEVRLGGTYTASGGVTGGAQLVSRGLEVDLGNKVSHLKLLGGEAIEVTAREAMGRMSVALDAADEITWRTDINANTLTSVGFNHGSAGGNKIVIFAPAAQRIDPQIEDYEGRVLFSTELRLLPNAGNDELMVTVK